MHHHTVQPVCCLSRASGVSDGEAKSRRGHSTCGSITYLVLLKGVHFWCSDSTCHTLAKKSSSKQAGLRAQIPLPRTRVWVLNESWKQIGENHKPEKNLSCVLYDSKKKKKILLKVQLPLCLVLTPPPPYLKKKSPFVFKLQKIWNSEHFLMIISKLWKQCIHGKHLCNWSHLPSQATLMNIPGGGGGWFWRQGVTT